MNKLPNIILTDHQERDHLLPLTYTRPVALIRIGLFTVSEKWSKKFGASVSYRTQPYLEKVFTEKVSSDNVYVNGAVLPSKEIIESILQMEDGESLFHGTTWIASRSSERIHSIPSEGKEIDHEITLLDRSWKIFQGNEVAIKEDFEFIRETGESQKVPAGVTVLGDQLFIDEGAKVFPSVINTLEGPVYIGKNATVMEGSMVRGPIALMDHSTLKMGAKIYGATTIGPHCKVGGEVNNCVIFGYSNKAHDGFIGNSVIGEWCNLGADTNTSNLKNNYATVKIYNYALGRSESTDSQFCGLTMADHAKSGINTMFNTGTVCGVFANVFGAGFPHRRVPDFGWGGADGFKRYRLSEAIDVAEKVMSRRGIALSKELKEVYTHIDELTQTK